MTDHDWETEIAALLAELADVQGELLVALGEKRQALSTGDHDVLAAIAAREQTLIERLQACHNRRQQLLANAESAGLPSDSIRSLSQQMPAASRQRLQADIRDAANRTHILQHQSLTNWVLVQRTLLHLSQMIEIIATGGRPKPTYGKGSDCQSSGALVDRAA
jgi:flagellar biosynthesis/type III secretory pathway chaperone